MGLARGVGFILDVRVVSARVNLSRDELQDNKHYTSEREKNQFKEDAAKTNNSYLVNLLYVSLGWLSQV